MADYPGSFWDLGLETSTRSTACASDPWLKTPFSAMCFYEVRDEACKDRLVFNVTM